MSCFTKLIAFSMFIFYENYLFSYRSWFLGHPVLVSLWWGQGTLVSSRLVRIPSAARQSVRENSFKIFQSANNKVMRVLFNGWWLNGLSRLLIWFYHMISVCINIKYVFGSLNWVQYYIGTCNFLLLVTHQFCPNRRFACL